jgi:autotransporter-associated beta strand protein
LQDVLGNSNASGTLSLDGGNFTGSAVGLNMLLSGGGATANLTINSGTATLPKLEIGSTSTSAGTAIINLNGGTMNLTTLTRNSTSANSTFNFNGGNLVVGGSSTTYLQGLTRANIRNGTTTINTAGYDITISQNLLHSNIAGDAATDGGLIKSGSGTLILNGSNAYTGTTTINAGTLAVTGGAALLDTGTVTLANTNGAVFAVNASETIGSLQGGGTSGGNTVIASG